MEMYELIYNYNNTFHSIIDTAEENESLKDVKGQRLWQQPFLKIASARKD